MKNAFLTIIAILVALCCTEPKVANASANDPVLGGCIICAQKAPDGTCLVCRLSAHPTIVQSLTAIDLKTSKLMYGVQAVNPGACYGVTYAPGEWYASGASFCLNVAHTEQTGNLVFPSGVIQLLKWGEAGVGGMCTEEFGGGSSLTCHGLLMFGANVPIE